MAQKGTQNSYPYVHEGCEFENRALPSLLDVKAFRAIIRSTLAVLIGSTPDTIEETNPEGLKVLRMKTVLIVDDCKTDRKFLGRIVIASGHNPEYAVDGFEALESAKTLNAGLILLDIQMPGMDGFAVCRKLRKLECTQDTPIAFVTSRTQEIDKVWGLKQGANVYVEKPVCAEDISRLIRRFL